MEWDDALGGPRTDPSQLAAERIEHRPKNVMAAYTHRRLPSDGWWGRLTNVFRRRRD